MNEGAANFETCKRCLGARAIELAGRPSRGGPARGVMAVLVLEVDPVHVEALEEPERSHGAQDSGRGGGLGHSIGAVDSRFATVDTRFDLLDSRFEAVDTRFDDWTVDQVNHFKVKNKLEMNMFSDHSIALGQVSALLFVHPASCL